ncbi:MAG: hypothetical protein PHE55_11455 [Methylococcaceae bacterium]|nr:hypothetical protein [Methylococcaceae bacterium]
MLKPFGFYQKTRNIAIATAIFLSLLTNTGSAFAERVRIDDPEVEGYALDYCREWATNCGKPAADAYCQSKGYEESVHFSVVNNSPPTLVINSGQVCDMPGCNRIVSVVCRYPGHHGHHRHHDRNDEQWQ